MWKEGERIAFSDAPLRVGVVAVAALAAAVAVAAPEVLARLRGLETARASRRRHNGGASHDVRAGEVGELLEFARTHHKHDI